MSLQLMRCVPVSAPAEPDCVFVDSASEFGRVNCESHRRRIGLKSVDSPGIFRVICFSIVFGLAGVVVGSILLYGALQLSQIRELTMKLLIVNGAFEFELLEMGSKQGE